MAAGTLITIDIDGIADPDVHDSWVRLLDSDGNIVTENDDGGGDPGSTTNRDSSTVFTVEETGTYYIVEGSWSPDAPGNGWSPSVPEGSTYELNVSVEFPPEPAQPGISGMDTLRGGSGSDLLDGGLAADFLAGDIFDGIGALGALAFGAFRSGPAGAAQDADDRILYDSDSGFLSYDADGSGQTAAIRFARLGTDLGLSAEDFYVV